MTTPTIPPARLPAAEAVDSDRNWAPHSDDFGPLIACLTACPAGVAHYRGVQLVPVAERRPRRKADTANWIQRLEVGAHD